MSDLSNVLSVVNEATANSQSFGLFAISTPDTMGIIILLLIYLRYDKELTFVQSKETLVKRV